MKQATNDHGIGKTAKIHTVELERIDDGWGGSDANATILIRKSGVSDYGVHLRSTTGSTDPLSYEDEIHLTLREARALIGELAKQIVMQEKAVQARSLQHAKDLIDR